MNTNLYTTVRGVLTGIALMLCMAVSHAQSPLTGGTSYPINGTDAPPTSFASIGSAWAYLDTNGVTGTGDLIFELSTGYAGEAGPITLGPVTGAGASTGLVVRPAAGFTATTTIAGGASPNQHAIAITGSYITLDGRSGGVGSSRNWTVECTGTTNAQMAVRINNTSNNVTNVAVRYLNMIASATSSTGAVFQITGGTGNTMQNVLVEHNYITSGATIRSYGVTIASASNAANTGVVFRNNDITDFSVRGINITAGMTDLEVSGNRIYNTKAISSASEYSAIYISTSTASTNYNVFNNYIYNIDLSAGSTAINGIYMFNAPTSGNGSKVYNNVVHLGGQLAGTAQNLPVYGIRENTVAAALLAVQHNTVLLTGEALSGTNVSAAFRRQAAGTAFEVNNNNFVNLRSNNGATGAHYGIISTLTAYLSLSNNNYAVSANGILGCYNSSTSATASTIAAGNISTIAAWRLATGDVVSISELPNFVSAGTGTTLPDLNIVTTIPTQLESSGIPTMVSTDINGVSRSATTPDMGAYEFAGTALDLTAPAFAYTGLGNQLSAATIAFNGVDISDASGVNVSSAKPRIYYKKSTNANALAGNTSADDGWKFVEATNAVAPFDFVMNMSLLTGGATMAGDTIQYFFVAQDLATNPNVGFSDGITPAAAASSVALSAAAFPVSGSFSDFTISSALSGTFTVGTGGDYASLTDSAGAFQAINSSVVTGNIVLNIISNLTESGSVALQPFAAPHTLTIQPNGGARVISGSTAAGAGLVNILASRVTIDGELSGSNSLSFENASTAASYAIHFNSVENVTIRNVNASVGTNGGTTLAVGIQIGGSNNQNILIENNLITKSNRGINVEGSTTTPNNGVIIRNNTIGDALAANSTTLRGINVASTNNYEVSGNTISNMVSGQTTMRAIHIEGNSSGGNISKNIIANVDYTAASFSGGQGIVVNSSNANLDVDVVNNSISGLKGHGSSTRTNNSWGIIIWAGNNARVIYNSINVSDNRATTSSSAFDGGILINNTGSTGIDVINNMISVTSVPGNTGGKSFAIFSAAANPFGTIRNNNYHVASGSQFFVGHNGTDRVSLSDWTTAVPADVNSISVDPLFTAATNLVPSAGAANDLAFVIPSITTDITGATRSATPDMGAYEFVAALCAAPGGLTAAVVNASSIGVVWTPSGSETAWEIEYGTTGFVQGTGTVLAVGSPGDTISGLTVGTTYDFYVRAVCNPTGPVVSSWSGPATLALDYCVSTATNPADSKVGYVRVGADTIVSPVGANNCAVYTNYTSSTPFQLTYGLPTSIEVAYGSCDGNYGSFGTVYIDFNNDLNFDPVTELVASGSVSAGSPLVVNAQIPAVAQHLGITRMRVVLRESGSASTNAPCGTYTYGETQDFSVNLNPAPSCVPPTALAVGTTDGNSATLTWTAGSGQQRYEIEYGTAGFAQGTGTVVVATASPFVVTSLMPQTAYGFYIRSICDTVANVSSPWAGPVLGTTTCLTQSLPSVQDWETPSTNPSIACWTRPTQWGLAPVSANGVGDSSVIISFYNLSSGSFDMISPEFASANSMLLSFDHAYASYQTENDRLLIWTSDDNGLTWDTLALLNGGVNGELVTAAPQLSAFVPTASQWSNYSTALPAGTNRIRFTGITAYGNNLYLDNIKVEAVSANAFNLLSPPNNTLLTVAGPGINTVNATWERAASTSTYTWMIDAPTGNFSAPLAQFPSNNSGADTVLTLTLNAIDGLLGSLGFNLGDTAFTKWTVRAITGTDTTFAVAPFNLQLIRGAIVNDTIINAFNLVGPANNTVLDVTGQSSTQANINWTAATTNNNVAVRYTWLLDAVGGNFSAPLAALASNNAGLDTNLTLNFGVIDGLLASLGLNIGDSVNTIWTVRATAGTNDTLAAQTFNLRLKRGAVTYPPLTTFVPQALNGTSALGRGPVTQNTFHRSAAIYTPAEVAAVLAPGQTITHIGYDLATAPAAAVSGTIKVYMANTTDATFQRSTTWATLISTPSAMNLVYDGALTIPATVGVYNIALDSLFNYTGGGLYVAFEWVVSGSTSTNAVYNCNSSLPASQFNTQNNTGLPATLTGTSAFRPRILLTAPRLTNDLEVLALYTLGKLPIPSGLPHPVQAVVRNNSASPVVARPVTLTVAGANNYTGTENVSLGVGATGTVTFNGYVPSNLGFNTVNVSVGADNNNANNSQGVVQEVTAGTFSYADTVTTNAGVGFNAGSGILAVRHSVTGTRAIESMRFRFSQATTNVGGRVYGVVLNSAGQIVARSPQFVIDSTMLGNYVPMTFDSAHIVSDDFFYVGLVQTPKTPGYFPGMYQNESPLRAGAFFTADTLGNGLASLPSTNNFKLIIEAITVTPSSSTDSLSAFALIAPANNTTLNINGVGSQTVSVNWNRSVATTGNPVTYEWLLDAPGGNFANPIVTIAANNSGADSVLTLNYAAIDALLAANGVAVGGNFTGIWTVRATSSTLERLAIAPRTITLNRGTVADSLSAFALLTPANNATLNISGAVSQTANITWEASTYTGVGTVAYTWLLDLPTGNFSTPLASIPATTNALTLTYAQIRDLLIANSVPVGTTVPLKWTVRATAGSINRLANASFDLSITRGATSLDTLSAFNLLSPSNNAVRAIENDPTQTVPFNFTVSTSTFGGTITYELLIDNATGDFTNPRMRVVGTSANSISVSFLQIADSLGLAAGQSFTGKWTIRAVNGPVNRLASASNNITFNRGAFTSVQDLSAAGAINLYPNPAKDQAFLNLNVQGLDQVTVKLVNAIGQEVMTKVVDAEAVGGLVELPLTELQQGMYFVRVTDGKHTAIKMLVVQR